MIYEARPNVTVDAASLCLKTGNAVVLRGGSAALSSNRTIISVLREALSRSSIPADALQLIEDSNRSSVDEMLKLNGLLDVIIPRGGASSFRTSFRTRRYPSSRRARASVTLSSTKAAITKWRSLSRSMPKPSALPCAIRWKRYCFTRSSLVSI